MLSGEHQTLLMWSAISLAWLVYASGVRGGFIRKPPKSTRQALSAMLLLLYATFIPLRGLVAEENLHGRWLAISIANVACAGLGAIVLMTVRGEGKPAVAHTMGRAAFTLYMAGMLVAIGIMVWAVDLRLAGRGSASSLTLGVLGYLAMAVPFVVVHLYLRRKARG
jgi:hypothetical protein